jgi:uncharacterized integral membrane protein
MFTFLEATPDIYQGHFGEFTISKRDRMEVAIYRSALLIAALTFGLGVTLLVCVESLSSILPFLTGLFLSFALALGVSLATIHIYMKGLHRALQICWGLGTLVAVYLIITQPEPLALLIYNHPLNLFGVGWLFVALTGIFFKEAFCFNHWETKILTGIVPLLLLGHWLHGLSPVAERILLMGWAGFFLLFAFRKIFQPIPSDIGDKSVFAYLRQNHQPSETYAVKPD